MKIEIQKTQETINDVANEPEYKITVIQTYGSGDFHRESSQCLHSLTIEDIHELKDRLNKDFLTPLTRESEEIK
jgi:hypothetical protein